MSSLVLRFFFFNDTATTEIYTLSLHDALPIFSDGGVSRIRAGQGDHEGYYATKRLARLVHSRGDPRGRPIGINLNHRSRDRKSTRLNSSHLVISYAVFCLKKKNNKNDKSFVHD